MPDVPPPGLLACWSPRSIYTQQGHIQFRVASTEPFYGAGMAPALAASLVGE